MPLFLNIPKNKKQKQKMNLFKELVKKYGLGLILGAATMDGYRRQIVNERKK